MKAGLLVALLLSAVLLIGGCTQEKEAGTPEESREGATEENYRRTHDRGEDDH